MRVSRTSWFAFAVLLAASPATGQDAAGDLLTLHGHQSAVNAAVFTPDGRRVLTASADHTARLWDATSGTLLQVFEAHQGPLYCLAVSGDGRLLVTGAQDNTLRLWDVPQDRPIQWIAAHTGPAAQIALLNEAQTVVSGGTDGKLCLLAWTADGRAPDADQLREGHSATITSTSARPDSAQFASADAGGLVLLWSPFLPQPQATLGAHSGGVAEIAFHPNNQQLLSAGADGTLKLWQLPTSPPRVLTGHAAAIRGLALVPNQPLAVTAGADKNVRIVRTDNGELVREITGHDRPLIAVAVSPNAALIAAADDTGRVRFWNLGDGGDRLSVAGHHGGVTSLAFHPDNQRLVTAGTGGTVRLWRVPQPPQSLGGHSGAIRAAAASLNGQWLATASDDRTTRLWNADGQELRQLPDHGQPVRSVAFRPDNAQLATGDAAGVVRLWNPNDGAQQGVVQAHGAAATHIAFSPAGDVLYTSGEDGLVKCWKLPLAGMQAPSEEDKPFASIKPERPLVGLAALPDGLVAGVDGTSAAVLLWETANRVGEEPIVQPARQFAGASAPLKLLALRPGTAELVAADADGRVHAWTIGDGQLVRTLETGAPVSGIQFSADGKLLAVAGGQQVTIYEAATQRPLEEVSSPTPVAEFALSADGRSLLIAGADSTLALHKRSLESLIDAHQAAVAAVAVTNNGQLFISGGADNAVHVWNTADGQKVRSFEGLAQPVTSVAVSPDSARIVAAASDGTVKVWNLADGTELRTVSHGAFVREVSLSPDGQRLATCGEDRLIRVWDLASGLEWQFFPGHEGPVTGVRFQNDNRTLVSSSEDRTVRVWSLSTLWATAAHTGEVLDLALLSGGGQAVTCGADGRTVMWNVGNGQKGREFELPVGRIANPSTVGRIANPSAPKEGSNNSGDGRIENPSCALAVRNDNARLAAAATDGAVRIWNPGDGSLLAELDGPPHIAALAFSPDNQKLAVCGQNELFIFGPPAPPRSGVEWTLHQQVAAESPFTDILFAPDNRRLFASHATGHVSEWLYAAPAPLRQFNHGGPVYGVAISGDGRTIVSCSGDQTVRVWDAAAGQQRAQLNGHQGAVYGLALTSDAALALSSGADGTLRLWDVAGGRQLKQISSSGGTVYSIALDPQGGRFATAGGDRTIRLHDLLTGAEQRALTGHSDYIHSVTFHPRGDRLLSYGYAGHLMLWNPADGARLSALQIGRVGNTAAYSPDGTRAVLATGNGEAHIITLPP